MVHHRDIVARITSPDVTLLDVILAHNGPGERANQAEDIGMDVDEDADFALDKG